jgi:hypothetical protein
MRAMVTSPARLSAQPSFTVPRLWDALKGALQSVNDYGPRFPVSDRQRTFKRKHRPRCLLRLIVLPLGDFGRKAGLSGLEMAQRL